VKTFPNPWLINIWKLGSNRSMCEWSYPWDSNL